ncbi:MAG: hypothetical protein ACKO0Z_09125, partial [Betaproteobacteria bacterium]
MTILAIGGEDHDFGNVGGMTVDTATTAARNTTRARCSLRVEPSPVTNGIQIPFKQTSSNFWCGAQWYCVSLPGLASLNNCEYITFLDGATKRLFLSVVNGATLNSAAYYQLVKRNAAGTNTVLQVSGTLPAGLTFQKIDVYVNYAVSGQVKVYVNGVEIINYSGDVTTDSATSLSQVKLGGIGTAASTYNYWSELIVNTNDTRSLNLVTLPPAANGNTFQWSNSYASVDETTINDTDLCATANANDVMQATVTS